MTSELARIFLCWPGSGVCLGAHPSGRVLAVQEAGLPVAGGGQAQCNGNGSGEARLIPGTAWQCESPGAKLLQQGKGHAAHFQHL